MCNKRWKNNHLLPKRAPYQELPMMEHHITAGPSTANTWQFTPIQPHQPSCLYHGLKLPKLPTSCKPPSKSFCRLHLSSQLLYYAQSVTASRLTTAILSLTGSSGFHFPSGNEPEESINFYLLFCSPVLPLCCITSIPCYFTNCFYQVHTKLFCTTAGELH